MSNKQDAGSAARADAEWQDAWSTVSRLAQARRETLREVTNATSEDAGAGDETAHSNSDGGNLVSSVADDHDHLENAIAEIEQASAALKRAEPALQPWSAQIHSGDETANPRSVWLLIALIWTMIALAIAGVVGAIRYVLT